MRLSIAGTASKPVPAEKACRSAGTEELGSPAAVAASATPEAYVEASLPLMMVSSTAEPKAPPIARAEKASPVAVERYACGAVNWTSATMSVKGPLWPSPAASSQITG